jgi:hypothetical protein
MPITVSQLEQEKLLPRIKAASSNSIVSPQLGHGILPV